jgi:hypothetical protein
MLYMIVERKDTEDEEVDIGEVRLRLLWETFLTQEVEVVVRSSRDLREQWRYCQRVALTQGKRRTVQRTVI